MSIGLLAILDDVSILLDDAATMTKVSMQKTAGLLGDDLAVNAKQASGFEASREIPILWKITKGALRNKIIILPFAFLLTAFAPSWVIPSILVLGGLYLAFEGAEKIHEVIEHKFLKNVHDQPLEIVMNEEEKIKSAILTDFILSVEIIVIALSTVLEQSFILQVIVVSAIALIATFGVYGFVTLIVRMDDMGFYLQEKSAEGSLKNKFGKLLVSSLPIIVKILAIVGTCAMLVVAGGLFNHNIGVIHHFYETVAFIPAILFDTILGLLVGYVLVIIFFLGRKILKK